ncbi:MAG: sialidase family protein [Capsulimonadaceae bacterium]|nr:sialidase family protein [Capsulimonadaceae bacterium]
MNRTIELPPSSKIVPGVVLAHSPASSRAYIGSPSIVILPNGSYVASHDYFGPGCPNNETVVYASTDFGESWRRIAFLRGQWWSTLFVHGGALYILGTSREYGSAVIRRSDDGGHCWTEPKDSATGLLLGDGMYHCAPVPVIAHQGRLVRGMEFMSAPPAWATGFEAFVMSVPSDADLLRADNWTRSNRLARDGAWMGGKFGGWLEGNAVVTPQGRLVDILRVESPGLIQKAAVVELSEDLSHASFDPERGFFDFPGAGTKFTIRHDSVSGLYWSLVNEARSGTNRNTLALSASRNLRDWSIRSLILSHPDAGYHAFQYVDWQFDGDDIIALSRTAYDDGVGGAHSFHDANFLTFHRITNFRTRHDSLA